jgi:hypothetical protein
MMERIFDVLVVGGGFAGAHAAVPLVEAGLSVAMLDGGIRGPSELHTLPQSGFDAFRKEYPRQHEVFLGRDLSGILPLDKKKGHAGNMTSGSRAYVSAMVDDVLPIEGNVVVLQSLAKGGLGEAWGAACEFFDSAELSAIGIHEDLREYYRAVIGRIGISGVHTEFDLQPPARLDENADRILKKYRANKRALEEIDVFQPPLALLTRDLGDRKATAYRDMDYWDDFGRSVYRPRYTIEDLEKRENFTYIPDSIVRRIYPEDGGVRIEARTLHGAEPVVYRARKVILAAGVPNSIRIILNSLGMYDTAVPFLTKPHVLVPCTQIAMLGKVADPCKHSLCQLVVRTKEPYLGITDCFAQLYSYKSLLLFKLMQYVPFSKPEALLLASLFASSFMVADIRFSAASLGNGTLSLKEEDDGSLLHIKYNDAADTRRQNAALRLVKRNLYRLGLIPLTTVRTEYGTASHYAGGIVPIDSDESPLRAHADGHLERMPDVFVADTTTWLKLPAKSPTLTIMANARRVGCAVARSLTT